MHGYNHNSDDKAQLISDNLDIVKKIAFYYVGRVGKVVEVDDLLQLGMVGLIEAAHNYTPKQDVTFASYAKLRVKGAIVDYLRKSSNLCRGTIRRKQDYERAKRKLEKELFRIPEAHEVAKEQPSYLNELYVEDCHAQHIADNCQTAPVAPVETIVTNPIEGSIKAATTSEQSSVIAANTSKQSYLQE